MSLRDSLNVLGREKKSTIFFSISIQKEITKIDKDGKEGVVSISYKIKSIDSASGKFIIKSYW